MTSVFQQIDKLEDQRNMFKYFILLRDFLPTFPENVKGKVLERINKMKEQEDMNADLLELDHLK